MHKTISYILIAALGTWAGGAIPDSVRPSLPKVVAKVALTNQTASIPATTLVTPTTGFPFTWFSHSRSPPRVTTPKTPIAPSWSPLFSGLTTEERRS